MKYLLIFFAFLLSLSGFSQPRDRKQIEADRVGVYTRVLNLTPDEAKKFWPVFDQYQSEIDKIRDQMLEMRRNTIRDFDKLSDADIEKSIDAMLSLQQQELDVRKKYVKEFKKVLSVRKVVLLQRAEREFKRELLHRLRDRKDMLDD